MKVYVTQGHEKGIGLEVFFKSILMLSREQIKSLSFIGYRDSAQKTLESLKLPFQINNNSIHLSGLIIKRSVSEFSRPHGIF